MLILLKIIFWISVIGLLHTYLFYPFILKLLAADKKQEIIPDLEATELPLVSVIMSAYNEEKVIEEKLNSLLVLDYPIHKLNIFIGSDCSSDRTNEMVAAYAQKYNHIYFSPFEERSGKPGVVNRLVDKIKTDYPLHANHIFLMTDASVILTPQTLKKIVRHFKNETINIVDANMVGTGIQSAGISKSENQYVNKEVLMKNREGLIWQKMIGPFGGCYAIRSIDFRKVPTNFLVDDFYITMKVFENGGNAINDLEAVCYEAVSHDMSEEYRRKARISAGNFQNLRTFKKLLWPPYKGVGFAFLSHKVLRWLGPFFIIFAFICTIVLSWYGSLFFTVILLLELSLLFGIPLLDFIFKKMNIHVQFFRNITYFNVMNIALLQGFFNYLKGIQKGTWEPTKRT